MVNDAQVLHDQTQELCALRDGIESEKQKLSDGMRQLQSLRQQLQAEKAAADSHSAAVAEAEQSLEALRLQLCEKRTELSEHNCKACPHPLDWQTINCWIPKRWALLQLRVHGPTQNVYWSCCP